MCVPAEIVHIRRKRRSPPVRYHRVVKFVVIFSAALTFLTLLDSSTETHGEISHRFLKAKGKETLAERNSRWARHKRKKKLRTEKRMKRKEMQEKKEKKAEKAKKKKLKSAINIDQFEWSETTEAFLPVLTKDAFKLFVDTFRSVLFCFHENGLNLIPTGGTLVGALRHKGMIPWDDDMDVYYFVKDRFAIVDPNGPVRKCLEEKGIMNSYYRGNGGPSNKNIRFTVDGQHMLSAFPAYYMENRYLDFWSGLVPTYNKTIYIDFVSQNIAEKRSPMLQEDIFPLIKHPFHDYQVYLPHNIEKYLAVDWSKNQVDKVKTPTYESLMSTVVSGHLHRGCKRAPVVGNITDVGFLQYYDPEDYLNTLPFRTEKCHGKLLKDYEEYVQSRRLAAVGGE